MSFFIFCSYGIIAQTAQNVEFKAVKYKPNVDMPLTVQEKEMIIEVYGAEAAKKYIFDLPQRLKHIKNILRNRVEIVELANKDVSDLTKLSDIPLFDHYQKIQRDNYIDKRSFNPLKYEFDFYGKETQYIRIDNTQNVIIITSQFK